MPSLDPFEGLGLNAPISTTGQRAVASVSQGGSEAATRNPFRAASPAAAAAPPTAKAQGLGLKREAAVSAFGQTLPSNVPTFKEDPVRRIGLILQGAIEGSQGKFTLVSRLKREAQADQALAMRRTTVGFNSMMQIMRISNSISDQDKRNRFISASFENLRPILGDDVDAFKELANSGAFDFRKYRWERIPTPGGGMKIWRLNINDPKDKVLFLNQPGTGAARISRHTVKGPDGTNLVTTKLVKGKPVIIGQVNLAGPSANPSSTLRTLKTPGGGTQVVEFPKDGDPIVKYEILAKDKDKFRFERFTNKRGEKMITKIDIKTGKDAWPGGPRKLADPEPGAAPASKLVDAQGNLTPNTSRSIESIAAAMRDGIRNLKTGQFEFRDDKKRKEFLALSATAERIMRISIKNKKPISAATAVQQAAIALGFIAGGTGSLNAPLDPPRKDDGTVDKSRLLVGFYYRNDKGTKALWDGKQMIPVKE